MNCIFCNKPIDSEEEEKYEQCRDDAFLGCIEYLLGLPVTTFGSDYCCLSCGEKFLYGIANNPKYVFEKLKEEKYF